MSLALSELESGACFGCDQAVVGSQAVGAHHLGISDRAQPRRIKKIAVALMDFLDDDETRRGRGCPEIMRHTNQSSTFHGLLIRKIRRHVRYAFL